VTRYIIDNNLVERTDPSYDRALAMAYDNKERPTCVCQSPGISMYIARIGTGYVLKRMPNSGQLHHSDCESYEIPSELSGRGQVEGNAISEDAETGITSLRVDFSLSKIAQAKAVGLGGASEQSAVQSDPTKLTIRSLLHYLYEDAGLNKWTPRMEGKRNWFIVRKYIFEACSNKIAGRNPITKSLLIPESFKVEQKDAIAARRRQLFGTLCPKGNKQKMGLLIAEVKAIEPARFGFKMIVKHMPDTPLYMGSDVYKKIYKHFSLELALFAENEAIHLLTIATFIISASGNPQIDTISFMLTDRNWLPFENIEELELLERLVTEKRKFIKGLRYNLQTSHVIASVLLTDIRDNPTAIYQIPTGANEHYYQDLQRVIIDSDLDSYTWDLNEEEPLRIPPKTS